MENASRQLENACKCFLLLPEGPLYLCIYENNKKLNDNDNDNAFDFNAYISVWSSISYINGPFCLFVGVLFVSKPLCTVLVICSLCFISFRCNLGYNGTRCEKECPDRTFGFQCKSICQCKNGATCSKTDGSCACKVGWLGSTCTAKCPSGYYGNACLEKCRCSEHASCDRFHGNCTCLGEYQGELCDQSMLIPRVYPYKASC